MSTVTSSPRKNTRSQFVLLMYVLAFDAIAIAVAWPIYVVPFFFATVSGAIAAASTIAWVQARRSWSLFTVIVVSLGAYLVLALPLTSPSSLASAGDAWRGWIGSVSGIALSWKQLVTIDLPVGTFQSLLVPAFLVFFVLNLVALSVAWRFPKLTWFPVIPMLLAPVFGIAFGYSEIARNIVMGGLVLPISYGTLGGIATLAFAIAFLTWGVRARRREALALGTSAGAPATESFGQVEEGNAARAGQLSGARGRAQRIRRTGMAIGVLSVTGIVVASIVSAVGVPSTRDVLRSAIDPDVAIRKEVSPLSAYRMYFTNADILANDLFEVASESTTPANVRLTALPYYDGNIFTVIPTTEANSVASSFAKIASEWSAPSGSADVYNSTITVRDLTTNGADSIWLPVVGATKTLAFRGDNARELSDAFFANRSTNAAVVIDPSGNQAPVLTPGSTYDLTSFVDSGYVDAAKLENPGAGSFDVATIPEKLVEWCSTQTGADATCYEGMGGAEFASLIGHLRARGYLSHELLEPQATDAQPTWATALSDQGYTFAPSLAGHSTARIDDMFGQLLDRQSVVGADQPDANLVAAVGDDEQFAAATALLASHVGFPSRVVVGFRLTEPTPGPDAGTYSIPACSDGICQGQNLTAWVEIQGKDGKWAALDVTPQFVNPIAPLDQGRQDPKNETKVVDKNAVVVPPNDANPANGEGTQEDQSGGLNLSWLWNLLQIVGLTLLIIVAILSPFALILGAKIRRRRIRRNAPDATRAVVGAWDELIDELVDSGYDIPRRQTRRQLAQEYALPSVLELANKADEAVFGPEDPKLAMVVESWDLVAKQRAGQRAELSLWQRVRLELSVRSFLRYLGPDPVRSLRAAGTSMTGASAASESGRFTAFLRFVGRETATVTRHATAWLKMKMVKMKTQRGSDRSGEPQLRDDP